MEKKINIAELLKDCPKGMELDCTMWDNAYLEQVDERAAYPIVINIGNTNTISLTKEGHWNKFPNAKCVIFPKGKTTWEGFVPPIEFKDGDVVISANNNIHLISCRYKNNGWESYCCIIYGKFDSTKTTDVFPVRLATEEEKQKLFDAIKANGYQWNAETKTLEKLIEPKFKIGDKVRHKTTNKNDIYEISKVYDDSYGLVGFTWMIYMKYQDQYELVANKFDINTLVPFESRVLVRDKDCYEWEGAVFGRYDGDKFFTIGGISWKYCIPYEGNEHLLGTTNNCNEFYRTWEK